jgi:hypothetical protein
VGTAARAAVDDDRRRVRRKKTSWRVQRPCLLGCGAMLACVSGERIVDAPVGVAGVLSRGGRWPVGASRAGDGEEDRDTDEAMTADDRSIGY